MGGLAEVIVAPPPGWATVAIPPPKIAENAGAIVASYVADGAPDASAAAVHGCVATPIPGWVEEMRPAVEARTVALAGAAAERVAGIPIDARSEGEGVFALRPASDVGGAPIGVSRTFLAWGPGEVLTCFAVCASRQHGAGKETGAWRACEPATRAAVLDRPTAPPRPGFFLGAASWAVHHPTPTAEAGAALLVALAILALWTRRRPRTRPPARGESGLG